MRTDRLFFCGMRVYRHLIQGAWVGKSTSVRFVPYIFGNARQSAGQQKESKGQNCVKG
jgi:hypothetical protein